MTLKIAFLDRDGTLIQEPADEQVDRLDKIALVPASIPALLRLREAGYEFVMVSNQDGRGTPSFPRRRISAACRISCSRCSPRRASRFARFLSARTSRPRAARCRKPRLGLLREFLSTTPFESRRQRRDRRSRHRSASSPPTWACAASASIRATCRPGRRSRMSWWTCRAWRWSSATRARRASAVSVDLDAEGPIRVEHRHRLLRPHAGAARPSTAASPWRWSARAICRSTSTTPSRTARSPSAKRCARRSATSAASAATASCSPWTRPRRRLPSTCPVAPMPCSKAASRARRSARLPTELVPHFFRSLADSLGAAIQISGQRREHPPHDRGLLQGHRRARCARHSPVRAASCRAPRACCDGAGGHHRWRWRQHRLAALRARAARRRIGADHGCDGDPRGQSCDSARRGRRPRRRWTRSAPAVWST